MFPGQRQRHQQQRPAFAIVGHDDQRCGFLVRANLQLPVTEKIVALIGRGELGLILQRAPCGRGLTEIGGDVHARDAACLRARWRACRPALDRRSHGHRKSPLDEGKNSEFPTSADLCKEVSTKGKDNVATSGVGPLRLGHASLRSDSQFLSKLKLEVGYFTGRARQRRDVGGAGVILRFARILPRRPGAFQPLELEEVTPRS